MNFSDIVQFLLYVIPGFISIEYFRARFPAKTRTDFITISWSIVFGVGITSLLIWLDSNALHGLLAYHPVGFPSLPFLASLVVAGFLIGISRVGLRQLRFLLSRHFPSLRWLAPDVNSIWARVNQTGTNQWAMVFLDDDVQYLGYIRYFRNDPDANDQDFLLAESFRVDKNRRVIYRVDGVGVYLNTRDIRRIEFLDSFVADSQADRTARRKKRTT
jgi:hypothetical protein